jgi:short-subunit dehydrogenase
MPEDLPARPRIVITGASSGIGRALALHYARAGADLGLVGRHRQRLEASAAEARALGAGVSIGAIDVRSRAELAQWITEFDRAAPVDLVIANAGVMEGTPPGGAIEPPDAAHALVEINVLGLLNTVQPLLPAMMARRRGQIALISSIAGFVPLADSPSYCASKAAVTSYGLSLRDLLGPYGVGVSVICPGYVSTPMMQREHGPKPFVMRAEDAAAIIARGILRNRPMVVLPRFFGTMTRITGMLPERLRRRINRSFRFTVGEPQ